MPPRPPRDPATVVRDLGGRATLPELTRLFTRHQVRAAVADGRLTRATRGIYVAPGLPEPELAAARARGALSHASAAQFWGLELVRRPDAVQLTVPRGARRPTQDGVRVRESALSDQELRDGATSPLRTVLDCATLLPFREALAVADSALALRFATADQLRTAAQASRGGGRPRRLAVVQHADRRAANAFESALRGTVLGRGLRGFEPQHAILVGGRELHADLGDGVRRIALEAEGYATHGTRAAFAADCGRYDELVRQGWLVLRFAWEQVMFEPDWVAEMVADACAQRDRPAGRRATRSS